MTTKREKMNIICATQKVVDKQQSELGGSTGLVVMGGDSSSKGCGLKSRHCILDGYFSHIFVVRVVIIVWGKDKNKQKDAGKS